jgi:surface protein
MLSNYISVATLSHTHSQAPLVDVTFKQATWEWVNLGTATATTKWGTIGDWDVSDVKDFSRAFSKDRNEAGTYADNGNSNAAAFVGTGMSKWNTALATTLLGMFYGAGLMNADLSKWDVRKVISMADTFNDCVAFTGKGLDR